MVLIGLTGARQLSSILKISWSPKSKSVSDIGSACLRSYQFVCLMPLLLCLCEVETTCIKTQSHDLECHFSNAYEFLCKGYDLIFAREGVELRTYRLVAGRSLPQLFELLFATR
jgi:hypothetical protein